jgi:GrpB-like predicted nucleotidyltransferase (UPF0157 family)
MNKKLGVDKQMLGLPWGEVFLVPWTNKWIREFEAEKQFIQKAIGQYTLNIHHIGSTAVKGLIAKQIIDIAIEIKNFSDGEKCVTALEGLGYLYRGTSPE